jgi:hypothetical protein
MKLSVEVACPGGMNGKASSFVPSGFYSRRRLTTPATTLPPCDPRANGLLCPRNALPIHPTLPRTLDRCLSLLPDVRGSRLLQPYALLFPIHSCRRPP